MIWKLIINTHVASALQKSLLMIAIINLLEGKYCLNSCKQIVIFVPNQRLRLARETPLAFQSPVLFTLQTFPEEKPQGSLGFQLSGIIVAAQTALHVVAAYLGGIIHFSM